MFNNIEDGRSLFGGLALVITGMLLTAKAAFFFEMDFFGRGIMRSRWWWEILLNLQILALAFMWFAHHNRILVSSGRWRIRAIANLLIGFVATAVPGLVLLTAAYFDWFRVLPTDERIRSIIWYGCFLWFLGAMAFPAFRSFVMRAEKPMYFFEVGWREALRWGAVHYWPGVLMIALMLIGHTFDVRVGYIMAPFLAYLQGATHYFTKSRRLTAYDLEY